MSTLYFRVQSDYQEVIRLREEIDKLKKSLADINPNTSSASFANMNKELAEMTDRLKELVSDAAKAGAELDKSLKKSAESTAVSTDSLTASLKNLGIAFLGGMGLKAFASQVMNVRGQFQQMEQSMLTMLGSREKADQLMAEIKDFAKISPLDLKSTVAATQMMVGFNIEAEKVPKFLRAIGDVSQGNAQKFNSLTLAFSQMSAAGKLMGQDLNQMINAGFNPLSEMSRITGKSIATLKEEMSKGAISAEMVQNAFISATSAGGKFYKMSEEGAKTINGQMSMLQDAMDNMFNEIGQKTEGVILSSIQSVTKLIESYDKVGIAIGGLVAAYGILKAAELTEIAMQTSLKTALLTNVTTIGKVTAAWKALSAVIMAHPYAAIAAALVAAGAAMYAFTDRTSAAEKEQERLAKRTEEQNKAIEDQKNEIDSLIATLQDETATTQKKVEAFNTLKQKYPEIFSKYETEKQLLDDLTEARKLENAEIEKKIGLQTKENLESDKDRLKELKEFKELRKMGRTRKNGKKKRTEEQQARYEELNEQFGSIRDLDAAIKETEESVNKQTKAVLEARNKAWDASIKTMGNSALTDERKKLVEALTNPLKAIYDNGERLDSEEIKRRVEQLDKEIATVEVKTAKQYTAEAKTAWEKAKKEVDRVKNSATEYRNLEEYQKALKKATDAEAQAKQKYKDLGGDVSTSKKTDKDYTDAINAQNQKIKQLEEKNAKERRRTEEDLNNQIEQARIDSLNSSFEKTKAQRDLNNKKEIQALERQKEDYIATYKQSMKEIHDAEEEVKLKKDKNYVKKEFDPTGISVDTSSYDKLIDYAKTKQSNYYRDLISEHQSYTDKKTAIDEKYAEDIEAINQGIIDAEANGDAKSADALRRSLIEATKERARSQMDLSLQELRESPEYVRAFEDMKNTSSETISILIGEFEKAKAAAAESLNPEDLREYTDALQQMYDELTSRDPFTAIKDSALELKKAQNEVKIAEERLNAVQKGASIVSTVKLNKETGKLEVTYLTEEEALQDVARAKDKENRATNNFVKAQKAAADVVENLAESFRNVGSAMGGIAGEVMSTIGNIMTFAITCSNAIKFTSEATSAAIRAMESASVILGVISAAIQLVTSVASLFSGKEDTSLKSYVSAMDSYVQMLTDDLRELSDAMNDSQTSMAESIELYKEYLELQKQTSEAIRNQSRIWLNSGASGNSHSEGYKIANDIKEGLKSSSAEVKQFYQNAFNELKAYYNEATGSVLGSANQLGRMDWLWNLSDEALKKLSENYDVMSVLGSELSSAILKYVDSLDTLADSEGELFSSLLEIDYDSFYDEFLDMISDMETDSKDFADSFGEQLRNALIRNLIASRYENELKKIYDKAGQYAQQGTLDTHIDDLKDEYQRLADSAKEEIETINQITGANGSFSQEASSKSWTSMSQSTGEELNGRFTALQEYGSQINQKEDIKISQLNLINTTMTEIRGINVECRDIASDARDMMAEMFLEVREINEHTGDTVKCLKLIQSDITEIKNNTK